MKVKYSISLKLTLIVVLLSTVIIILLSFLNLAMQSDREDLIYDEASQWGVRNFAKSHEILELLDDELANYERFNKTESLSNYISKLQSNYTRILKININVPTPDGLIINISTDNESIGSSPNPFSNDTFNQGDTYYIVDSVEPILTIVSPVNVSGDIIGTYEVIILMDPEPLSNEAQIQLIIIITSVSIFILIFSILYLLRRAIVKPIVKFRNTAEVIGKGDLDTKIDINSSDELGDLASAFNQMAKDLKESRDKIEDYNEILENLLDRKDEFIGQLGHDLKNPLQPLIGLLPSLVEKEADPEKKELLQIMSNNAEHMKELIHDTLELAKLRSETIEFDMEDLNLKQEVDKAIDSQKLLLRDNKIEAVNKISDDIIVEADKLRLSEVFTNLITNSVKYTDESGGSITIDAEKEKGGVIKVSVSDTGIGMTKEQIDKIFDEFYKADKFSSEYSSTGLGLAIVKRIIEKFDGRIWVESDGPGKGSAFYFTLKSKAKNN